MERAVEKRYEKEKENHTPTHTQNTRATMMNALYVDTWSFVPI